MLRVLLSLFLLSVLSACVNYDYKSQIKTGEPLISFKGQSLDGTPYELPVALQGKNALLLFGYIHKSQFDIDRWLIGLNQIQVDVAVFEIPAIQGFIPRLLSTRFDDSMREGIPRELWADVITVYEDGDRVQRFTGNESPKNARVVLLDENGVVTHFYDRGFSVNALNEVAKAVSDLN
jgi:hypothetical protein